MNHYVTKIKKKKEKEKKSSLHNIFNILQHSPHPFNIGYTTTLYFRVIPTTMGPMMMQIPILFIIKHFRISLSSQLKKKTIIHSRTRHDV